MTSMLNENFSQAKPTERPRITLQKVERVIREGRKEKRDGKGNITRPATPDETKMFMCLEGSVPLEDGTIRSRQVDVGAHDYILYQDKFRTALNNLFCYLNNGPSLHDIAVAKKEKNNERTQS